MGKGGDILKADRIRKILSDFASMVLKIIDDCRDSEDPASFEMSYQPFPKMEDFPPFPSTGARNGQIF